MKTASARSTKVLLLNEQLGRYPSCIPERGAPTRVAIVSGFTEGWYELAHASGRADRVTWDARKLPYLFVHGEFGGTDEEPFKDRFYTLALQPMSRNPYLRSTTIL